MSNYYTDSYGMKKRQKFEQAQALARQVSAPQQPKAVQPTPLKVLDLDFEIDPEILTRVQGPLHDLIEDALRFANGDLKRRDLEAALQAFVLSVDEMQIECECLRPAPFKHGDRVITSIFVAAQNCPHCQGKGWVWR